MKIIDFECTGNVVRFYLGKDNEKDYHGDDWNDTPYECNAGTVYSSSNQRGRCMPQIFHDTAQELCFAAWARACALDQNTLPIQSQIQQLEHNLPENTLSAPL